MTENLLLLNQIVAGGTLALEIILALCILFFIFAQDRFLGFINYFKSYKNLFFKSWTRILLCIVFIFSLIASAMTLVYSEYFGIIPCALCWLGRVFMYGTVLISAIALFSKSDIEKKSIMKYILTFSIFGFITALYHHILQMTAGSGSSLPCPTSGGDCAKRLIFEYGHITFPWLAVIMFSTFIFIYFVDKKLK